MMKKNILVLAIVMFGLSSCRKDRTCTCTDGSTTLGTFNYTNVKKSEAKTYCQSNQTQYQTSNPGTVCTVK